jgi:general secretion pathway protein G
MIVSAVRPAMVRGTTNSRRSAFTLLEVLVVVAILVILASVGSVYIFRYLEDAKGDATLLKMKQLEKTCQSYSVKNGGNWPETLDELIRPLDGNEPFLDGGSEAIMSGWGTPIQYTIIAHPETGEQVPTFRSQSANGKRVVVWPQWAK